MAGGAKGELWGAAGELACSGPSPLGRSRRSGRYWIGGVVLGDELRRGFRDPVAIQVLDGLVRATDAALKL